MGHKKRKQDSDNEDDVEHSASDSDVSDRKVKKSKVRPNHGDITNIADHHDQSTSTKGKQSSASKTKTAKKPKIDESDNEVGL